jgi:hypothetical protein
MSYGHLSKAIRPITIAHDAKNRFYSNLKSFTGMTMPYQTTLYRVRETLHTTFAKIEPYFELPEEQRDFRPEPDEWSINEILEHITLTSHFLLIVIRNSRVKVLRRAATQPILDGESDLDALANIGHPDAFPWIRPEHMEPSRDKLIDAVRHTMLEQKRDCFAILDQIANGEGSLHKVRMSVQNLGKLDMYQWLYFLAQHAQRHSIEIERIRAKWQDTQE